MTEEYVNDIFEYLNQKEMQQRVDFDYMSRQKDISSGMRAILIDWLTDVTTEYHLTVDTFHLTVTLIDRYLATTVINSKEQNPQKHFCVQASLFTLGANLQCVGVAAMMIASKFEEIYPPTIHDFVYISDNAFKEADLVKTEKLILETLNYELCYVTPIHFVHRYCEAANSKQEGFLSFVKYALEVASVEYGYLHFEPSLLAASAVFLAQVVVDSADPDNSANVWSTSLILCTGWEFYHVQGCAKQLAKWIRVHGKGQKLKAAYRRYKTRFFGVAKLPIPPEFD